MRFATSGSAALVLIALSLAAAPTLSAQQTTFRRGGAPRQDTRHQAQVLAARSRLRVRGVSLREALGALHEASGVSLLFSPDLMPDVVVTCECIEESVGEALAILLRGTGLYVHVQRNQILITRVAPVQPTLSASSSRVLSTPTVRPLPATLAPGPSQALGVISGRLEDSHTGLPVREAQVYISALDIGVLSGADGRYVLPAVPAGTHTLTVNRIGYGASDAAVTVRAGEAAVADFTIAEEALQLDEVIVTGTPGGTQRRALGNVVARMDLSAIREVSPSMNLEEAIGTRVPGVATLPSGGFVGAGAADIRIRGSSSVGLPNDPIIYIDGVRINADRAESRRQTTSRLNDISPEDIASIEVIKGPAAATLYGTEASNGVIQIITKRGQEGAVRFEASVELGANFMINPEDKVWTNYATHPTSGELLQMNILKAYGKRNGQPLMQNGPIRDVSLSAQGGTPAIRYYASFSRNDQEGPVSWNWDRSNTARLNLDLPLNEKLSVGVAGFVMSGETRLAGDFWVQTMRGNPLSAADYGGVGSPLRGWGSLTPEALRDGQEWMFHTQRKSVSVTAQFAPWPWLNQRITGGVDLTDQVETDLIYREKDAPNGIRGSAGLGSKTVFDIQTELSTLDYAATAAVSVTDRLGSSTSLGFQYYEKKFWETGASGEEFATELLTTVGATARTNGFEDQIANVTAGFYVQEQLDWADRLFVTGAVRFDKNSAFGAEYGVQVYPKASATWVISEERFWDWDFLNPLRLRAAWGGAGRQPDIFAAQQLYRPVTGPGNQPTLTPFRYGNAKLGPEKAHELEVGFDANLFGRAELQFTAYWKRTTDGIVDQLLVPSLGFPGSRFINAGETTNWGTELSLGFQVIGEGRIRWDVHIAATTMDNRIVSLGKSTERIFLQRSREHVVGFPLAGLHDYKVVSADFVNGKRGVVKNLLCDGGIPSGAGYLPGGPAVPCEDAPRVYWGPTHNKWTINASSTWVLFRDWRLRATLEGRGGGILHADQVGARHTSWRNSLAIQQQTDPIFMGQLEVSRNPTGYVRNGHLSLAEVGLQCDLPGGWASRIGAGRASVLVSARNLGFLWREQWYTDLGHEKVFDVRQTIGTEEYGGQQDSQAPLSSSFVVRVRVSF